MGLTSCDELQTTFEQERSDLKNRAYDINYTFVNEVKILSALAKKMEAGKHSRDRLNYLSNEDGSVFARVGNLNPKSDSRKHLPKEIDSVLLRHIGEAIFLSKVVIGSEGDYFIYPKMNREFLNRETLRLKHLLGHENENKNLSDLLAVDTFYEFI